MTQKELDLEAAERLEDFANKLTDLTQLSETDIFNVTAALTYAITTLRGNNNAPTVSLDMAQVLAYESGKASNERLINEYISKVECCDECFASVYCTVNGLREDRVPQDYCVDNIKRYFCGSANLMEVQDIEEPFITESRDAAIKKDLPLYVVYYGETGILEVYVTETKELFEKRHCSKHLSRPEVEEIATHYLDYYSDWKRSMEE